jgi:integrase/recombinase XerD
MNASLKVLLNKQKVYLNGEYPIRIRVTKDRKPNYIPLGLSCRPGLWDEKLGLPKGKHPMYAEYSENIKMKLENTEKFILKSEKENLDLSSAEIVSLLKRVRTDKMLLYDYFQEVVDRLKASGQIRNSAVYRDTMNTLKKFNDSKLNFSDITFAFLRKFEEYLKSTGKGSNTVYIYLRTFRALINRAIKETVCKPEYYGFKDFSLKDYKKFQTKKRAISKADIYKIRDLDTEGDQKLTDAKNVFLFSYYCRGINFIDICNLKYSDVDNTNLNYIRQKTSGFFNMELLQPALEIIEYYKEFTFNTSNSYIFPLFHDSHVTKLSKYNRQVKMLTVINKSLKDIALKCNINCDLTTYVARHTYATVMKKSGHSTGLISESMGHSSESVTKIYLESFENSFLDEANKSIL